MKTPNFSELPNTILKRDRRDAGTSFKAGVISHSPEDAQAIMATRMHTET